MTLEYPEKRETILAIDTSTNVCSVALHDGAEVIAEYSSMKKNTHAEIITACIDHLMKTSRITFAQLSAIAIAQGPGSYTGLRIGLSIAKGFCFALNLPIIGIDTLEAMAWGVKKFINTDHKALLCPMLDARRMEVYTLIMDHDANIHLPSCAMVIGEGSLDEWLGTHTILFFGDGSEKCKPILGKNKNSVFCQGIYPSARNIAELAHIKKHSANYEKDLPSYISPTYLKEFGQK